MNTRVERMVASGEGVVSRQLNGSPAEPERAWAANAIGEHEPSSPRGPPGARGSAYEYCSSPPPHARMQLIDCHETALHKVLSLVSENSALDLDGLVVYTASLCVLLSPSVGVDLALA